MRGSTLLDLKAGLEGLGRTGGTKANARKALRQVYTIRWRIGGSYPGVDAGGWEWVRLDSKLAESQVCGVSETLGLTKRRFPSSCSRRRSLWGMLFEFVEGVNLSSRSGSCFGTLHGSVHSWRRRFAVFKPRREVMHLPRGCSIFSPSPHPRAVPC